MFSHKLLIFATTLLILCGSHVAWSAPAGYTLQTQYSDDFNYGATQWNNTTPWIELHDLTKKWRDAYLDRDGATTTGTALQVRAYTDSTGHHHTGYVKSSAKFQYGYFEARLQFRSRPGQWGAFWLFDPRIAQTGGGAADPETEGVEVDIVEHRLVDKNNTLIRNRAQHALHWNGYGAGKQSRSDATEFASPQFQWHTYGLRWTPTQYTFYIDDEVVWLTTAAGEVSQIPQEVRFSVEVEDGAWAGNITAAGFGPLVNWRNGAVYVDYFRYYAPNDGNYLVVP